MFVCPPKLSLFPKNIIVNCNKNFLKEYTYIYTDTDNFSDI